LANRSVEIGAQAFVSTVAAGIEMAVFAVGEEVTDSAQAGKETAFVLPGQGVQGREGGEDPDSVSEPGNNFEQGFEDEPQFRGGKIDGPVCGDGAVDRGFSRKAGLPGAHGVTDIGHGKAQAYDFGKKIGEALFEDFKKALFVLGSCDGRYGRARNITIYAQICRGVQAMGMKNGQGFLYALHDSRQAPHGLVGFGVRRIHADPKIAYPCFRQGFDELTQILHVSIHARSVSVDGKHIPVGAAPQIPDAPAARVVEEGKGLVDIDEGLASGKGHRVDPVPGA
jgi:hypothetical protein